MHLQSSFTETETIYVRVFEERMDLMRAAIGCCSVKRSEVSKSFLSRQSYPFFFSNVGTEETAPEIRVPLKVWNMLALMLEKSSKAARGREKELHSPRFFSQFFLVPSPFNKS